MTATVPAVSFALTVGAGVANVRGRVVPLEAENLVASAATALQQWGPGEEEAWVSPHQWEGASRASTSKWLGSCAVFVDVDCGEDVPDDRGVVKREKRAKPSEAIASLRKAHENHLVPGSLLYGTPHGYRIVFVLGAAEEQAELWTRAALGANELVRKAFLAAEIPVPSVGVIGFAVDARATVDRKHHFYAPTTVVNGVARRSPITQIRPEPYTLDELAAAAPKAAPASNGASAKSRDRTPAREVDEAVDAYNRAHAREWPRANGQCPICTHDDCFHALKEESSRWICESTSHPEEAGRRTPSGRMGGDVLDVDVWCAGRRGQDGRIEHLRAAGFLSERRRRAITIVPPSPTAAPDARAQILLPGEHAANPAVEAVPADEFADATLSVLKPGDLYRRAGEVGQLAPDGGVLRFVPCTDQSARLVIEARARLVRGVKPQRASISEAYWHATTCTRDIAGLVLARASQSSRVRELNLLTQYPIFIGPRFERAKAGWNDAAGVYFDEPPELRDLEPTNATESDLQAELIDLVVDFPFREAASRENFFGLLLTPILRPSIDGNVPMHMLLAPLERTGKTKLAEDVLGGIILGRPTLAMPIGWSPEEIEKRIAALALGGETLIHLDNVRELDSPGLASLLTADTPAARPFGRLKIMGVRNVMTTVASGNNVRAAGENAKRCVPIWLQPSSSNPELREDFAHPDLRSFIRGARRRILSLLLGMVERWKLEGQPLSKKRIGGFERWAAVVGGILELHGCADWMNNYRDWIKAADSDGVDLQRFVELWAERFVTEQKKAADLFAIAEDANLFGHLWANRRDDHGKLIAFSKRVLMASCDRPVGDWTIRRLDSGRNTFWRLERQAGAAPFEAAPAPPTPPEQQTFNPDWLSGRED